MMPTAATVFVVDDNPAVRKSLQTLFAAAGLDVESYASSREFLAAFDPRRAGCLVLDLKLRGESGLDLLDELGKRRAALPVLVLTAHGSVATSVRAMKAGAIDFVEKPMPPAQLLVRVREALELAGQRQAMDAMQRLVEERAARLTPREQQVAQLLLAGKRSKEIAVSLGVSRRTVEGYRSKLLDKMHVESATELVATLLRARVVLRT
jgi:two-component system, LuxR family, response regulator FixJ